MDKDILKEDLKTYRNIETWGTALFLTGIALIGKFIRGNADICLPTWISIIPGCIGLYAFIFLLIVNRRGRVTRARIDDKKEIDPRGWLGWMFALMPVLFGLIVSSGLEASNLCLISVVAILAILVAIYFYLYDYLYSPINKKCEQINALVKSLLSRYFDI